jgi:predicted nucleotidyltransferase
MSAEFDKLLPVLVRGRVEFILIGGVAAIVHGAARLTYDVDVVYARPRANLQALVRALKPFAPYLRGAPPGLPFVWDERTLRNGLNFTLTTKLGDLDLLGEVTGGGGYGDLLRHAFDVQAFGVEFKCVDLPTLIKLKRAAGRPKDWEALAELEALLKEQGAARSKPA